MSFEEFHDFENSMKKIFVSEMELKKSEQIQRIIDYFGFTIPEVMNFIKLENSDFLIPYQGMLPGHPKYSYNVAGMRSALQLGFKKLRFICSPSASKMITEVLIFPQHLEHKYFVNFSKLEKLKAFL